MDNLEHALSRIPCAIADPAFHACVFQAAKNDELVTNFKRLRGLFSVDSNFAREFTKFVHEFVYTRLDAAALAALRIPTNPTQEA